MHNFAEEFSQARDESGREVLVEEQLHPRFALRPISAAYW
jgi:hypothetical protein